MTQLVQFLKEMGLLTQNLVFDSASRQQDMVGCAPFKNRNSLFFFFFAFCCLLGNYRGQQVNLRDVKPFDRDCWSCQLPYFCLKKSPYICVFLNLGRKEDITICPCSSNSYSFSNQASYSKACLLFCPNSTLPYGQLLRINKNNEKSRFNLVLR